MRITDNFVFFWGDFLSNWAASPIVYEDKNFLTSEQLFMFLKAQYFNDSDTALEILLSESPKEAKKLGRKVKGFNEQAWSNYRETAMEISVYAKFAQNPDFRDMLLNPKYDNKIFVEASPFDRIWGIGFREDDEPEDFISEWGLNLLGKIINKVRERLKNEFTD